MISKQNFICFTANYVNENISGKNEVEQKKMFQEGCFKLHHAMSYDKVAKIWILKGHEAMIPMPNENIEVEIIQMPPMESDENKVQHSYLNQLLNDSDGLRLNLSETFELKNFLILVFLVFWQR